MVDLVRALLPRYAGPGLRLYRGEAASNRRRRTYGLSWSATIDVATGFASARQEQYMGGTVLLETDAPAESIVCGIHEISNGYEEQEYLVDRRLLRGVRVIQRMSPPISE